MTAQYTPTPVDSPAPKAAGAQQDDNVHIFGAAPIGDVSEVEFLGRGVYWVGMREDTDAFHLNPYLIVDGPDAVLIDPGGLLTGDAIKARVESVVDLKAIKYIVAHHQDPDVCSAVNHFRPHVAPDCKLVCHSRVSVLIQHFGAGFEFYPVDKNGWELTFGSGRTLTFAHTPYLHSPGAIVTYDAQTATVFSSDIFGGVTPQWDLFGNASTLGAIEAFHIDYMPSREILQNGIESIKQLGDVRRICPQHGSVLEGDLVQQAFKNISKLEVGNYAGSVAEEQKRQRRQALRMRQLTESARVSLMAADTDGTIIYINPAGQKLFASIEDALPCRAADMVGQSFDIFHQSPHHQRTLLKDHINQLPRQTLISVGPYKLSLTAFAIYDDDGVWMGPAVMWENVTEKLAQEQQSLQVKASVSDMVVSLAGSSQQLNEVSLTLSSAAEETSSQASAVSESAVGVADNINVVMRSLSDMVDSVGEIARNASMSADVVRQAVDYAGEANHKVGDLSSSSAEIGKVIKVIASIAQQTNLLALNATIEAARAGDMGRGFAVVANAIKELAKKTADSTDDITEKIEKIQSVAGEVEGSIGQITDIIKKVDDISATIASAVEEQSVTTAQISENMSDAADGMNEISDNINSVAEAAVETAEGASHTLKSTEALEEVSSQLRDMVTEL